MVQTLTSCTDFGVPVGTYFGDGIRKGSDPCRSSKLDHYRLCGYSFMLRPTKTARPGAGENIGRALSQKKLSYQA